jgi:hypothetical protein
MSLEIVKKKRLENIYIVPNDGFFDLSQAIISISDFFQTYPRLDLYTGMENIPFEEREPEYKKILLSEFL